jgi:hypothetical protein
MEIDFDKLYCDCKDCVFRGMEDCELRKNIDAMNRLRKTIVEAKDRMCYYFGTFDGKFSDPQLQNVYDVLCRDDEWWYNSTKLK